MNDFLIFYAPFLVLIAAIVVSFVTAAKDEAVRKNDNDPR